MLFHVRMDVRLPHGLDSHARTELLERERDYAQRLQHAGRWLCLWRIAGEYANISVFDVGSPDQLHYLPLFPHLWIRVTALATHPCAIDPSH